MAIRNILTLLVSIYILLAISACGDPPKPRGPASTGTILGTVSGTVIIAVDDSGAIVASDNTAGEIPDASGNYIFSLDEIPVEKNIRVYLMTANGTFPLYFGVPNTNVFSLSSLFDPETTIDLGFVDTTLVQGQAIPANDLTAIAGVDAETVNTTTPVLPAGGTFIVQVTDENSGAPLSGVTVIVDHASDPRQEGTTTDVGTASFTSLNGGPVTVTVGKSGYELGTLVGTNIAFLNVSIDPMGLSAFIQGTATTNYTGPVGVVMSVDFDEGCPSCENLSNGTPGFYKLNTSHLDRVSNLTAFDFGGGSAPINFTAVTGIDPLVTSEIFIWDPVFPSTPPATTLTTGTITVPASLGAIEEVAALGWSELVAGGELFVGLSFPGSTSPYPYNLTTFAFAGGTNDVLARAVGIAGGETVSILRGVGFGGSSVDFSLIELPTNLSPTSSCGSTAPTLSWTAVPGVSYYEVELTGIPSDWKIAIDGGSTSFALPDLTDTPIDPLGLLSGLPVNWTVSAVVVPDFDINTINFEMVIRTFTDISESAEVTCVP